MRLSIFSLFALTAAAALLAFGGCSSSYSPTGSGYGGGGGGGGGTGTQVSISYSSFSSLTVPKGTTVTWKNNDSVTHTATADNSSAFQFDTGDIAPGATSGGVTFTQSGTFEYHCKYHSTMHGTITVQ